MSIQTTAIQKAKNGERLSFTEALYLYENVRFNRFGNLGKTGKNPPKRTKSLLQYKPPYQFI